MSAGSEAVVYLEKIQRNFDGHSALSREAEALRLAFLGGVGGPETSGAMLRSLQRFAEQAAHEVIDAQTRRGPKPKDPGTYKTSIFKCLADYEKCCLTHDWRLCGALVAVCIAKQLIPFAPRG